MLAFLPLLMLATATQALYFFIDPDSPKCFYEDLPKDTLVVGQFTSKEWDDKANAWQQHNGLSIFITVEVSLLPPPQPSSPEEGTADPASFPANKETLAGNL